MPHKHVSDKREVPLNKFHRNVHIHLSTKNYIIFPCIACIKNHPKLYNRSYINPWAMVTNYYPSENIENMNIGNKL